MTTTTAHRTPPARMGFFAGVLAAGALCLALGLADKVEGDEAGLFPLPETVERGEGPHALPGAEEPYPVPR